jgi:hypothetical protein
LPAPAVLGAAAVPAYSLVTPKWMPLAGVSKQHAKVEREVRAAVAALRSLSAYFPLCRHVRSCSKP